MKGFCDICGTEIELHMCCSGYQCGCMGMPTEPPVCSENCWILYQNKFLKEVEQKEKEK